MISRSAGYRVLGDTGDDEFTQDPDQILNVSARHPRLLDDNIRASSKDGSIVAATIDKNLETERSDNAESTKIRSIMSMLWSSTALISGKQFL